MKVNEKLKKIRKNKKITLEEVGNKLNYSFRTISDIESGKIRLTLEVYLKLCEIYDINPLEFIKKNNLNYIILTQEEIEEIDKAIKLLQKIKNKTLNNFSK